MILLEIDIWISLNPTQHVYGFKFGLEFRSAQHLIGFAYLSSLGGN